MMFWHDPAYEKAREIMATKMQGETLDWDMRDKTTQPIPVIAAE